MEFASYVICALTFCVVVLFLLLVEVYYQQPHRRRSVLDWFWNRPTEAWDAPRFDRSNERYQQTYTTIPPQYLPRPNGSTLTPYEPEPLHRPSEYNEPEPAPVAPITLPVFGPDGSVLPADMSCDGAGDPRFYEPSVLASRNRRGWDAHDAAMEQPYFAQPVSHRHHQFGPNGSII